MADLKVTNAPLGDRHGAGEGAGEGPVPGQGRIFASRILLYNRHGNDGLSTLHPLQPNLYHSPPEANNETNNQAAPRRPGVVPVPFARRPHIVRMSSECRRAVVPVSSGRRPPVVPMSSGCRHFLRFQCP